MTWPVGGPAGDFHLFYPPACPSRNHPLDCCKKIFTHRRGYAPGPRIFFMEDPVTGTGSVLIGIDTLSLYAREAVLADVILCLAWKKCKKTGADFP
jgi:hypothetical protein